MPLPRRFLLALAAVTAASIAPAQALVLPAGSAGVEGDSSTAYPWNRNSSVIHVQYCYDASNFTAQGVVAPILINRLRWRANSTTVASTGGSYATAVVDLSTAAVDHAALTTVFAANHGPDRLQVYAGPVTVLPTPPVPITTPLTPGIFHVDLPIAPFLYDPAAGDLMIDIAVPPNVFSGASTTPLDARAAGVAASRVFNLASDTAPTGTVQSSFGAVVEVGFTPANVLFPNFNADVTAGATPLQVAFTSRSWTSDPGGITSYAWDFDGDAVVDSTAPNPTFTYATCGTFDVSLTVTDAVHPPQTRTKVHYVSTDDIVASFTVALLGPPDVYQLTDTSTPPATAWAWDFDGDGIANSTLRNPVVVLPLCQPATITLRATRNCKTSTTERSLFVAARELLTTFTTNNGLPANFATVYFDIQVTNPIGVNICGLDVNTGTTTVGTQFTLAAWVTPGSHTGVTDVPGAWRLAATGTGVAAGNNVPSIVALSQPIFLPPGSYGLAVYHVGAGVRYFDPGVTTPTTVTNADLTLTLGSARTTTAPFTGGSLFFPRVWSGTIHYDTSQTGGLAGMGFFGAGCAGTLPVSRQSVLERPVLGGTLRVTFDRLPVDLALGLLGFSNTLFSGVPLPIDLGVIGAPGCAARVSADMDFLLFGAGQQATLAVAVPSSTTLLGVPFFTQAAVLDNTNALGAVLSDAWAGVVGR
jgi:hypothetical protein